MDGRKKPLQCRLDQRRKGKWWWRGKSREKIEIEFKSWNSRLVIVKIRITKTDTNTILTEFSASFKVPLTTWKNSISYLFTRSHSHMIAVRLWCFIGLIFRSVIRYSEHFPTLDRSRLRSTCMCVCVCIRFGCCCSD